MNVTVNAVFIQYSTLKTIFQEQPVNSLLFRINMPHFLKILPLMTLLCKRAYDEHYGKLGIDFPTIKVKDMRSRWGSCISSKKILTFNVHLMEYPLPAAEYVVAHEFTHFLQANHSARFYAELARYMPDYKQREKLLK